MFPTNLKSHLVNCKILLEFIAISKGRADKTAVMILRRSCIKRLANRTKAIENKRHDNFATKCLFDKTKSLNIKLANMCGANI